MDKIIKNILEKLEKKGYKAYVVGGFVRDYLLGINSFDVDICTNALPKEVYKLFNVNDTNNYGGCNIKLKKYNIDITTFRREDNIQNRNTFEIEYVTDLAQDLLRRDFTINAICMDKNENVIDKLNGIDDLNNCLIKMIGDPKKRLEEDPLRILRTIRFAANLNFKIDDKLYQAIKNNVHLLNNLSKGVIKNEFTKIFMNKNFIKALKLCQELDVAQVLNIEFTDPVYTTDVLGMWSQIKIKGIPFTKIEKNTIIDIETLVNKGNITALDIYDKGLYICTVAAQILNYDLKEINKMAKKLPIKSDKDILITSEEIMTILGVEASKEIGVLKKIIKEKILNGELANNKKILKKFVERYKEGN